MSLARKIIVVFLLVKKTPPVEDTSDMLWSLAYLMVCKEGKHARLPLSKIVLSNMDDTPRVQYFWPKITELVALLSDDGKNILARAEDTLQEHMEDLDELFPADRLDGPHDTENNFDPLDEPNGGGIGAAINEHLLNEGGIGVEMVEGGQVMRAAADVAKVKNEILSPSSSSSVKQSWKRKLTHAFETVEPVELSS
jgi:hypothetical protein